MPAAPTGPCDPEGCIDTPHVLLDDVGASASIFEELRHAKELAGQCDDDGCLRDPSWMPVVGREGLPRRYDHVLIHQHCASSTVTVLWLSTFKMLPRTIQCR